MKAAVYTPLGGKVSTLADTDVGPGTYNFPWCGVNASNERVATGAYFLHVESPGRKKDYPIVIVK